MMEKLQYGNTEINYSIFYSNRKTLGIVVEPNGAVIIKAPVDASLKKISEKVKKRASWIVKQQSFFKSFGKHLPERRYISGESHFYLGRQYRLYVKEGRPNSVSFKGQCFEIVCSPKSKAEVLMKEWYRERAKVKFAEIAESIIQHFKKYEVEPQSLYVQLMENRWGSCTAKGKIILNTELIKAPKPCIEYVITHEMCHLLHKNHTKAFYELLQTKMPDWEMWKNKLEKMLY
jgi:predicted metal-dependent hydrolase